jgi:hypothetical protein
VRGICETCFLFASADIQRDFVMLEGSAKHGYLIDEERILLFT